MESTDLIPMDGDVAKITKRAEEFRELPDALQRNLQTFLALTMDVLAAVHQKVKASSLPDVTRQAVRVPYPTPAHKLETLTVPTDSSRAPQKVQVAHHICWEPQVQDVTRCILVSCTTGRGDRAVIASCHCTLHDIALKEWDYDLLFDAARDRVFAQIKSS